MRLLIFLLCFNAPAIINAQLWKGSESKAIDGVIHTLLSNKFSLKKSNTVTERGDSYYEIKAFTEQVLINFFDTVYMYRAFSEDQKILSLQAKIEYLKFSITLFDETLDKIPLDSILVERSVSVEKPFYAEEFSIYYKINQTKQLIAMTFINQEKIIGFVLNSEFKLKN